MLDLDTLADGLLAEPEADRPPTWLQVRRIGGLTTLVRSGDPDGLLGWVAPPECLAVGVVAPGRAVPLDATPPEAAGGRPVRVVCLLDRAGRVVSRLAGADGTVARAPATGGYLLDCLARCLGRPTPPPPEGPGRLLAGAWLRAALDAATTAGRPLTWAEVLDLHPLPGVAGSGATQPRSRPAPRAGTSGDIPSADPAAATTWARLRALAAGGWPGAGVEARLAAWMDDGMFARCVLAPLPPADALRRLVAPRLTARARCRLARCLDALEPRPTATHRRPPPGGAAGLRSSPG